MVVPGKLTVFIASKQGMLRADVVDANRRGAPPFNQWARLPKRGSITRGNSHDHSQDISQIRGAEHRRLCCGAGVRRARGRHAALDRRGRRRVPASGAARMAADAAGRHGRGTRHRRGGPAARAWQAARPHRSRLSRLRRLRQLGDAGDRAGQPGPQPALSRVRLAYRRGGQERRRSARFSDAGGNRCG